MKEIKKSASIKSKVKGKQIPFNIDLNYSPEYDSFIVKVKKDVGFMSYTDSLQGLPLEVVQKINEMLEEVLIKAGSEGETKEYDNDYADIGQFSLSDSEGKKTEKEYIELGKKIVKTKFNGDLGKAYDSVVRNKREFGGDFQSGVYANGGNIEIDNLNKNTDLRDKMIDYIVSNKAYGKRMSDRQYDALEKRISDKSFVELKKEYDALKGNSSFANGGFMDGVYAMGGSLKAHGIEVGDTFVKTISGNIQKVKDKNGKIVYVDLSTGERDSQPPLPFENGGGVGMEEDIDLSDDNRLRVRKPAMPNRKLTNQELAEKHNSSAYEFMTDDKKAFGGSLFSSVKMIPKARKYPNLQDKDVVLKNGKLVKVFSQSENKLTVMEFGKIGSGERPMIVDISEVETIYKNGGALVGNQSRIDMNKNGKIDANDFKLLRSSMNGAWRNDHKHVNHNEDYEVRYARPRPNRKGYKGIRRFGEGGDLFENYDKQPKELAEIVDFYMNKFNDGDYDYEDSKNFLNEVEAIGYTFDYGLDNEPYNLRPIRKMATGGGISKFEKLSFNVAKNYEGKSVKPKYQKQYGKRYSTAEAREVGNRVAGKIKASQKMATGGEVKSSDLKVESGMSAGKKTWEVSYPKIEDKGVYFQDQYTKEEAKEHWLKNVASKYKFATGGQTKKSGNGSIMVLAKKIRKDGESWQDALKRAGQQLK